MNKNQKTHDQNHDHIHCNYHQHYRYNRQMITPIIMACIMLISTTFTFCNGFTFPSLSSSMIHHHHHHHYHHHQQQQEKKQQQQFHKNQQEQQQKKLTSLSLSNFNEDESRYEQSNDNNNNDGIVGNNGDSGDVNDYIDNENMRNSMNNNNNDDEMSTTPTVPDTNWMTEEYRGRNNDIGGAATAAGADEDKNAPDNATRDWIRSRGSSDSDDDGGDVTSLFRDKNNDSSKNVAPSSNDKSNNQNNNDNSSSSSSSSDSSMGSSYGASIPDLGLSVGDEVMSNSRDTFVTELEPIFTRSKDMARIVTTTSTFAANAAAANGPNIGMGSGGGEEPHRYLVSILGDDHDGDTSDNNIHNGERPFAMIDVPPYSPSLVSLDWGMVIFFFVCLLFMVC